MKNETKKKNKLGGLFIFVDEKSGENVYFDILTKGAYLITQAKTQKYVMYSTRFIVEITLFVLIITQFSLNIYYGVLVFVGILIAGELFFRYSFLYKQPKLKEFIRHKGDNFFIRIAKDTEYNRCIAIIVFSLILVAVGIINYYVTTYNSYGAIMFLFETGMLIVGAVLALFYLLIIIIKLFKKI